VSVACRHRPSPRPRSELDLSTQPRGHRAPLRLAAGRAQELGGGRVISFPAARPQHTGLPLEYRVLGPFEVVRRGSGAVQLRAARERALLLCLLLRPNQIVPVDELIHVIWGERPPRCAANALQNCVSHLRKLLHPCAAMTRLLLTKPPGYLLRVRHEQLDSMRLEALLARSREACAYGALDQAVKLLREAEGLWRGPALADFSFEDFARGEIARLEELRLLTLAERIDVELALGRDAVLVCELRRLVAEHPLHERFRGQLMLALYRSDRQADALAVYREAWKVFVQELGISPSRTLQVLEGAILRQEVSLHEPIFGCFTCWSTISRIDPHA
jgi:DNA-binding SARP family transcriptional activator